MTSFSDKIRELKIWRSNEQFVSQNSDFVRGEHDSIGDDTISLILENNFILQDCSKTDIFDYCKNFSIDFVISY